MRSNPSVHVESTALVIHVLHTGDGDQVTVAAHDIDNSGDTPRLKAGHVLDEKAKADMAAILNDEISRQSGGFIDERVLMREPDRLVWYRKRQKTTVQLPSGEITIPLPSLVFDLCKGRLRVIAYDGDRRPTPDTVVRTCGLPNIAFTGEWCSGGNRLPESPSQGRIEQIEDTFFKSPFTHMNGSMPETMGEDWEQFYRDLKGKPRFPMKSLPHLEANRFNDDKLTLGQWLRG